MHTLTVVGDANLRPRVVIAGLHASGNAHALSFEFYNGLSDLSALGGVHARTLKYCLDAADVSALGGVRHLWLE